MSQQQLSGCFLTGEKKELLPPPLRISEQISRCCPSLLSTKHTGKGTSSTFWLAPDFRNIAHIAPHGGFVPLCCILPWLAPTYSEEVVAS